MSRTTNKTTNKTTSKATAPIPAGFHSLTPYLICKNARAAIDFYKKALGAREVFCMEAGPGKIGHAELLIGNSHIMLADEFPEMGAKSPEGFGGSPVSFVLYVEDVDFSAKQAVSAGMSTLREVKDQFYGDRSGTFKDPFGHTWTISTHVEDIQAEEMKARAAKAFSEGSCS